MVFIIIQVMSIIKCAEGKLLAPFMKIIFVNIFGLILISSNV